ncbi:14 kDa phosphohistidine phosphatase [Lampris incognitus]|uniref:14 kDa phosphohistidine phosphatase n=1 Tax=Lampris incognitus TaxID=2546036 RepID=UPI0024B5F5BA|nr:14 kDa phosphohistidine phosphatase [Lampris incognitus]
MLGVVRRTASRVVTRRGACVAMADALSGVPDVEIDPEGTFKYILVEVKVKGGDAHKCVVRGTKSAEYHNHIFEKLGPAMESLGLECKCLGGGKMEHNSKDKKLRVFGESTGFGKADHSVSVEKLRGAYAGYEITWSDEKK